MTNLSARIAIAGMVAMAQSGIALAADTFHVAARATAPARKSLGGSVFISAWNYPSGPGWSVAQVKRMAKKRRNQARHRRNCRK